MTALNDDDVIEKPSDLGYYFLFLKDLMYSTAFIQSFINRV